MMTSNHAYVWVWLPKSTKPVVAGRVEAVDDKLIFVYGRSYLHRDDAISLFPDELPLVPGEQPLLEGLNYPSCIRDAAPDAWGRRVILNKKYGRAARNIDPGQVRELDYLLLSGSDRIGALDFQISADQYTPREIENASMEELLTAADRVEKGLPLSPELERAILHGSSIGGARPKALVVDGGKKYIAKFSSTSDTRNIVKGEYVAMRLAALVGLNVAPVKLVQAAKKDVLLVERFDREKVNQGWTRKLMVSGLTLQHLDELMARYASYETLAEKIRHDFASPDSTLRELYSRLVFNVLSGNTDDHARNHAAFWDGKKLSLTPAYDICPQDRAGNEASQGMLIVGQDRSSRIETCVSAAHNFLLDELDAIEIAENQIEIINDNWDHVCEAAELSQVDKNMLWKRQFLNPFSVGEYGGNAFSLSPR